MSYIGWLNGYILDIKSDYLLLNVQNVGYIVFLNSGVLSNLQCNHELKLYIFQKITEFDVRLFGFIKEIDRDFFCFLLKIRGVSTKIAFSILDNHHEFCNAIKEKDSGRLENFPGIGKKIAERLIVESAKFVEEKFDLSNIDIDQQEKIIEVELALKQFGYSTKEVKNTIQKLHAKKYIQEVPELIKIALNMLQK